MQSVRTIPQAVHIILILPTVTEEGICLFDITVGNISLKNRRGKYFCNV